MEYANLPEPTPTKYTNIYVYKFDEITEQLNSYHFSFCLFFLVSYLVPATINAVISDWKMFTSFWSDSIECYSVTEAILNVNDC